ncbi:hypothetical protein BOTBODRAFT_136995 [Botryobasidium botryosum FD-172 SS1]|uniref:Uncharacterized protein n=1 Tax=Botryobasidium botryosum (strain FD-172 SS1) TaxID=930990 RepID=A0A067MF82_BOTB1|nr:hypothetical protein BOTBODRAFT_136995 [Botryobasidium botryosum FD-172 SS1]
MTDRLRLLHFPPQIINVVRDALKGSWKRGIQDERVYGGAHEFKMKGNPWEAQGNEAAPARIMVTAVLASLYHEGWNLISSTDVSKKSNDKDTFFFRHNSSITPHPSTFFAISFNEDDKLRLIGAPPDVIPVLQNVLAVHKQKEQWKLADVAYEFKLKGYPWKADGEATVATRLMLLQIIEALGTIGFEIYASIDMCTGPSNGDEGDGADTDTWILRRPKY